MKNRSPAVPVALVLALSASLVGADCREIPENRVENCSFETGDPPAGWNLLHGFDFQRADGGFSGDFAGSALAEPAIITAPPFALLESACFDTGDRTYEFGVRFRREAHAWCWARLRHFSQPSCQGFGTGHDSPLVEAEDGFWLATSGTAAVPEGSARLELTCESHRDLSEPFLFDDAFVVPLRIVVDVPASDRRGLVVLAGLLALVALAWIGRMSR